MRAVWCVCIVHCGVWCVVQCVVCGVCVSCFGVCGVCAWCVCVLCVWRDLARGKHPVCRFKTSPCVGPKTPACVPAKRPHVEQMRAFGRYTRMPFEPTHGDVLNLHTEGLSLSSETNLHTPDG